MNPSPARPVPILGPDGRWLFATRMVRLFAYGFLSVVLALYLTELGLSETQIGLLLTLTLMGDTLISLWITTHADQIGRRKMLLAGAIMMILAGLAFILTRNYLLLILAATFGVVSPSGNEVGPFLSIEQAALSQLLPNDRRTSIFAWYNLVGSFATALGALTGGNLAQMFRDFGYPSLVAYRFVIAGYGLMGLVLVASFQRLSPLIEADPSSTPILEEKKANRPFLGLSGSRQTVLKLAGLFSLDAFAGGFVIQSLVAYWFAIRFGVEPGLLGGIFFGANLLAGISALSAAWVARHIGLIRTMVFTHLPSNVLLMAVPLMPNLPMAVAVLLLRFSISQMDVPIRQSYTMAVVEPAERSAASGVTGVARTIGASLSPVFTGLLLSNPALIGLPFMISGSLKIVYDLALYRSFRTLRPPEEM